LRKKNPLDGHLHPSDPGAGILVVKLITGLDGIQAWKLGMKEKERQERESELLRSSGDTEHSGRAKVTETQAVPPTEPPLDEIQLIKLMIKREEEKNKAASFKSPVNDPAVAYLVPKLILVGSGVSYLFMFVNHSRSSIRQKLPTSTWTFKPLLALPRPLQWRRWHPHGPIH